jgi:hypothetical protein
MVMRDFNWTCPHCERAVTITSGRFSYGKHTLGIENADARVTLCSSYMVCPNPECTSFTLTAVLYESAWQSSGGTGQEKMGEELRQWNLVPELSC